MGSESIVVIRTQSKRFTAVAGRRVEATSRCPPGREAVDRYGFVTATARPNADYTDYADPTGGITGWRLGL